MPCKKEDVRRSWQLFETSPNLERPPPVAVTLAALAEEPRPPLDLAALRAQARRLAEDKETKEVGTQYTEGPSTAATSGAVPPVSEHADGGAEVSSSVRVATSWAGVSFGC